MFLDPAQWPAWQLCPGRAALEEGQSGATEAADWPALTATQMKDVETRRQGHIASGAIRSELILGARLDLEVVTGERGAIDRADALILAEYKEHSIVDVFRADASDQHLAMLALGAVVKYQMLHNFVAVNLCALGGAKLVQTTWSLDQLYIFGQEVTEAAAVALALRGGAAALSNLVPGDVQCKDCRVAYRCPALARKLLLGEDDGEIA
jgi:hypothetical protein